MPASFLHKKATRRSGLPETGPPGPASQNIDWHALKSADRGCCCPAKPAVIAVLPAVPGRSHPTDLLLCGHHYRVSRQALVTAGAAIFSLDGTPVVMDARQPWPVDGPAVGKVIAASPPGTSHG